MLQYAHGLYISFVPFRSLYVHIQFCSRSYELCIWRITINKNQNKKKTILQSGCLAIITLWMEITWGIFYEAQHGNSRLPFEKRLGRHIIIIFIFWKQTIFLEKRKPSVSNVYTILRVQKLDTLCTIHACLSDTNKSTLIRSISTRFLSPLLDYFENFRFTKRMAIWWLSDILKILSSVAIDRNECV